MPYARFLSPNLSAGLALLLAGLSLGCSKEDPGPVAPEVPDVLLTAFANAGGEELQMDIGPQGQQVQVSSLSETLGLQNLPFYRRVITNTSVGYYFWQDQRSVASFKDLGTGNTSILEDICGFSGETGTAKTIRRVSGNEAFVVMAYAEFPPGEGTRFALRILEKATGACRDLPVPEVNATGIESYSIEGEILALYYQQAGTGTPLIALINLRTGTVGETLILEAGFQAATFRGTDLWIFNDDASYLVYDTRARVVSRTGNAPGMPAQGPGMFTTRFSGNRMEVRFIYQQPSLFFAQPAVYDFDAGQLAEGSEPFLPQLQARIERETGDRVLFGNYAVDLDRGLVALIYVRGNGIAEGGVVLTNFRQDWLRVIPLPLVPEAVLIRRGPS